MPKKHEQNEERATDRVAQPLGGEEVASSMHVATTLSRYRDFFVHMAEGVVFQDEDGRIVDANPAALHLLGLSIEQLRGLTSFDPLWRAIHLDGTEVPSAMHPAVVALRTGQAVRDAVMGVFIPGENRHRWLRVNATPQIIPGRERPVGVFVTFDDITEWDYLQETAHIQEARYQALLEQAADAVFVADLEGRYIEVNPAACALLGFTRAELLRMRIVDVIPAEDAHRLEVVRNELLQGGTHRGEWRLRRKDGLIVPVELSARMTSDGRWQIVGRDIIAHKQLEADLRTAERASAAAEARFRALIEQAPDSIITLDAQGRITLVNHETERLFGYTRDTLLGQSVERLIPSRFETRHRMHRAMYSANPHVRPMGLGLELFGRHADGTEFPVEISLAPMRANGDVRVIATCRDMTQRRQLEQDLRARTEELTRTFDAMHEGVYIYDRSGELIQMNATARAVAGYDAKSASEIGPTHVRMGRLNLRDATGRPMPSEDWPVTRVLRGEIISPTEPIEMTVTTAAGQELTLHATGAPLRDGDGRLAGAVVVTHDVTQQHRLEQQRMDIFKVVAHDLGTPLAALKLYVQTEQKRVARTPPGQMPVPPDPGMLDGMAYVVERMQRLLGDIWVMVGLEANSLPFERRSFDLAALCKQEAQALEVAGEREVRVTLPEHPVLVEGDPDRIGQVITNLLSNADKYSPLERPISLTLRLERAPANERMAVSEDAQEQVTVLVHDEGPGIPSREQERIWERFHRVPGVQARPGTEGSLGLGLYISHEIVQRLGGAMGMESAPSEGSTFWFTLSQTQRS